MWYEQRDPILDFKRPGKGQMKNCKWFMCVILYIVQFSNSAYVVRIFSFIKLKAVTYESVAHLKFEWRTLYIVFFSSSVPGKQCLAVLCYYIHYYTFNLWERSNCDNRKKKSMLHGTVAYTIQHSHEWADGWLMLRAFFRKKEDFFIGLFW